MCLFPEKKYRVSFLNISKPLKWEYYWIFKNQTRGSQWHLVIIFRSNLKSLSIKLENKEKIPKISCKYLPLIFHLLRHFVVSQWYYPMEFLVQFKESRSCLFNKYTHTHTYTCLCICTYARDLPDLQFFLNVPLTYCTWKCDNTFYTAKSFLVLCLHLASCFNFGAVATKERFWKVALQLLLLTDVGTSHTVRELCAQGRCGDRSLPCIPISAEFLTIWHLMFSSKRAPSLLVATLLPSKAVVVIWEYPPSTRKWARWTLKTTDSPCYLLGFLWHSWPHLQRHSTHRASPLTGSSGPLLVVFCKVRSMLR